MLSVVTSLLYASHNVTQQPSAAAPPLLIQQATTTTTTLPATTISVTTSPTIIPRRVGNFTITVNGSGHANGEKVLVVACPDARGDDTPLADDFASAFCPDFETNMTGVQGITANSSGSYSYNYTFAITQEILDEGALTFAAGSTSNFEERSKTFVLQIAAAPTTMPTATTTRPTTTTT